MIYSSDFVETFVDGMIDGPHYFVLAIRLVHSANVTDIKEAIVEPTDMVERLLHQLELAVVSN